jgi:ABC-2 type transport system permease protein
MLAIFNKEFKSYFSSASGYIFMSVFLLISGVFFAMSNLLGASAYYTSVLGSITFVFLIIVPVLTMRILSEESRQKTDQLLLTAPISVTDIVLGKYLAAVALFFLTLLVTCLYPMILSMFGSLAVWEIVGGYIGFALFGASLISIGVFISSLTDNQVASAVGTFGSLLFIWILDWIQQGLPTSRISGIVFAAILAVSVSAIVYSSTRNIYITAGTAAIGAIAIAAVYLLKKELFEGFTVKFFGWFSLLKRYDSFSMGILSVNSIIF